MPWASEWRGGARKRGESTAAAAAQHLHVHINKQQQERQRRHCNGSDTTERTICSMLCNNEILYIERCTAHAPSPPSGVHIAQCDSNANIHSFSRGSHTATHRYKCVAHRCDVCVPTSAKSALHSSTACAPWQYRLPATVDILQYIQHAIQSGTRYNKTRIHRNDWEMKRP